MSNFRDAVKKVQADAADGDLAALEKTLHDPHAERAARLVAANLLAQAGELGRNVLRIAILLGEEPTQLVAAQAYLRTQQRLDESLFLEMARSKNPRVSRHMHRLLRRLPHPVSAEFRLRCQLPTPYFRTWDLDTSIAQWLTVGFPDWGQIVDAVCTAQYSPAIPLLIDALGKRIHQVDALAEAFRRLGPASTPALIAALPDSVEPQRSGIIRSLQAIGSAEALEAVRHLTPVDHEVAYAGVDIPALEEELNRPLDLQLSLATRAALSEAARLPSLNTKTTPVRAVRRSVTRFWNRLRGK